MPILRRTVLGSAFALPLAHAAYAAAPPQAGQAPSFYRYRVGDIQVTAIHDGVAVRSTENFVPNAPAGELQKTLADVGLPTDRFPISFTTLVLNTGSKLVLIDTGNGEFAAPTSGTWMANFRAAGFDPAQVDTVVFSHFHGDHINGFRNKAGQAVFPNAQAMVPEAEWAFWTSDSEAARAPAGIKPTFDNVKRVFGPVMKDVTPYAWDKEIVPGLTSIRADGHTPGHTAFALVSGAGKLMIMSDTTNNPQIFARNPGWSAVFDQDGPAAVVTRRRMLDIASTEKMPVSFYHAPFPATGTIIRETEGYRFVPAMWSAQA